MASLVKRFTGFMSPAPKPSAPKRIPSDPDPDPDPPSPSQNASMNKGTKRKADPYEDYDVEDSLVGTSPAASLRASSRRSSEALASGRKTSARESVERRSRGSTQKSAVADGSSPLKTVVGEKEPSAQLNGDVITAANEGKPRAPMAPMANMDSLGPLEPLDNNNAVLNPPKPSTTRERPARQETLADKAKPVSDKERVRGKDTTGDGKSEATEEPNDEEAPVDKDADNLVEEALENQEFDETAQDEECEVDKLIKHRRLPDGNVEMLVKWVDESDEQATYEPEEEIQRGAAEALYDYWKAQGGRTEALFRKPKNPPAETYYVFKILSHQKQKGGQFEFEVQWVGYPATPKNTSKEKETKLKKVCAHLVAEYWESVGGREKHLGKRGRSAKKVRSR